MQYVLKILDDLIVNQMNLSHSRVFINEDILKEWLYTSQIEACKIKEVITDEVFRLLEYKDIKQFISMHHSKLIYLSDMLLFNIEQNSNQKVVIPENLVSVQKAIFFVIDDLLHFIWKYYSEYCNKDQKIPEKYKIFIVRDFSMKLENIDLNGENHPSILLNIALMPIKKVIENNRINITFRTTYYLREMLNEIIQCISDPKKDKEEGRLINRLIFINYNSIHFINYLVSYFRRELDQINNVTEKIEKLTWYLKTLNQILVKPNCIFNSKQPEIKEFLIQWILEEISYLEKKLQLAGIPETEQQIIEQNFKIVTELSVPQAACLIRLFVEAGVFKNKNKTDLIKFYAMYTQSKRKENITFQSFRTKYYNIEESSKQEIKALIIHLLNEIQKL
jgi:hypothetical protein